jgi:hypothetical protein
MKTPSRLILAAGTILFGIAVILQYYLILIHRTESVVETTLRFVTFFTILTNSLCAAYFCTLLFFPGSQLAKFFEKYTSVTAICVYITIVGLVYQFILRHTWQPQGLQRLVDELLHSVNPLCMILYWVFLVEKRKINLKTAFVWLLYPILYFTVILIRGSFADWYPYPFVNVSVLGYGQVFVNALVILGAFFLVSVVFIATGSFRTAPRTNV